MDERHQRRIARNQARIRELNDLTRQGIDSFQSTTSYPVMCECALSECDDMLELPTDDYDAVRSNAGWYVVLPEHTMQAVEEVVEDCGAWWIIRKLDASLRVAADDYNAGDE